MSLPLTEPWTPISINRAVNLHPPTTTTDGGHICSLDIRSEARLGTDPQVRRIRIAISVTINTTSSERSNNPTEIQYQPFCNEIMKNVHRRDFASLGEISDQVTRSLAKEWHCEGLTINIGAVYTDPRAVIGVGCQMVLRGGTPSDGSTSDSIMHPSRHLWSIRGLEVPCFIGSDPDGQKGMLDGKQYKTQYKTQQQMPLIKIDLRFQAKADDRTFPEFTEKLERWQEISEEAYNFVDQHEFDSLDDLATRLVGFTFTKCPLFGIRVSCHLQLPLSMPSFSGSLEVEVSRDRGATGIEYEAGSDDFSEASVEVEADSCD